MMPDTLWLIVLPLLVVLALYLGRIAPLFWGDDDADERWR